MTNSPSVDPSVHQMELGVGTALKGALNDLEQTKPSAVYNLNPLEVPPLKLENVDIVLWDF